ncbi:MAG TPA: cation diffusion facilitator family transporter [Rhizomicrobium sp.]|nr:cation diffusion facilitator family transporter [Rhizomicrobium sp.]
MSTLSPDGGQHESIARAGALMRRAAIASVSVSLFLVGIKTFAYFASHSVAMLASLADSALDLFASSLNMIAIRSALTPADAEHRFGHGKAEPLAGLAQGAFISASALFLVLQAVQRIITPEPLDNSIPALVVMGISIFVTILLVLYQRRVVAKTGSVAVEADTTHYASDLATNVGVIVALVLVTWLGWTLADPLIAIAVAAMMLFTALGVGRQSFHQLMDRELPDEERARILRIARSHAAVKNVHDLKTRMAGLSTFIQLHLGLDPQISLVEAHAISDAVEQALLAAFPGAEVIIHQDPAGLEPLPDQPD